MRKKRSTLPLWTEIGKRIYGSAPSWCSDWNRRSSGQSASFSVAAAHLHDKPASLSNVWSKTLYNCCVILIHPIENIKKLRLCKYRDSLWSPTIDVHFLSRAFMLCRSKYLNQSIWIQNKCTCCCSFCLRRVLAIVIFVDNYQSKCQCLAQCDLMLDTDAFWCTLDSLWCEQLCLAGIYRNLSLEWLSTFINNP